MSSHQLLFHQSLCKSITDSVGLGKAEILDLRGFGKAKPSEAFAVLCCRNTKSVSAAFHSVWLRDFVVIVVLSL